MKIRIDIDCTPQEARAFLGLPHLEPMQEALVAQLQERLAQYLEGMEPDALMSAWLPSGLKGLTALQEQFWEQMAAAMQDPGGRKKD